MTGSYFRGDAEAVLAPEDEAKFETVTYTYYEQLNGYEYLKSLDIGYFFYTGRYLDAIMKVLDPGAEDDRPHPERELPREHEGQDQGGRARSWTRLGEWKGADPATGFHLVKLPDGRILKIADLVDDDPAKRDKVFGGAERPGADATTATMWTSSLRSAWRRRASTGFGASTR